VFQLTSIAGGRGGTIWLHSCVVGVVVGRCPVASGGGDGRGSSCQRRWHRFKGLAVRADWDVVYFAYHFRHLRHLRNTKRQTNNVSTRRKRPSSSTVKTGKKLASHGATLVPLDRPRLPVSENHDLHTQEKNRSARAKLRLKTSLFKPGFEIVKS
jgi:hypothetical protein